MAAHGGSQTFHLKKQKAHWKRKQRYFWSSSLVRACLGLKVQNLMEATYYLQRKMINTTPAHTLEYLKSQWPYLFAPRSMCTHFEMLTDINILRTGSIS
uniref:Uncharacterized protein n=1 Tax=Anguilla anguilla TaxID=7936 RepID=A0A0E9QVK1_ANGAN